MERFPALNLALDKKNEMALEFLGNALEKCKRIQHLRMYSNDPVDYILRSLRPPVYDRLKSVALDEGDTNAQERGRITMIPENSPLPFIQALHDQRFKLTVKCDLMKQQVDIDRLQVLDTVLKLSAHWKRSVHLQLDVDESMISGLLIHPSVHSLELFSIGDVSPQFFMLVSEKFPNFISLVLSDVTEHRRHLFSALSSLAATNLSTLNISNNYVISGNLEMLFCSCFPSLVMSNCELSWRDLYCLADANGKGKLPKLFTLDISRNWPIGGKLSVLMSQQFPLLHTLVLSDCWLVMCDLTSLVDQTQLPKLRHLDISFNFHESSDYQFILTTLLSRRNPLWITVVVRQCRLNFYALNGLKTKGKYLADLITLDMTDNPGVSGCLSVLMRHYFPKLNILILRQCGLISSDMSSLAQAINCGRLPELRHLDLSLNTIGWGSKCLLELLVESEGFPSLNNLILCKCLLTVQDLCCLRQAGLDGKFPRIRHLDISFNGLSDHVGILSRDPITQSEITWGNVICYDKQVAR